MAIWAYNMLHSPVGVLSFTDRFRVVIAEEASYSLVSAIGESVWEQISTGSYVLHIGRSALAPTANLSFTDQC